MKPESQVQAPAAAEMTRAEAERCCKQIRDHLDGARKQILDLYNRKGWVALGYRSWRECVVAEFEQSQAYLYRLLEAAKIEAEISPMGEIGTLPERQLRPLSRVPEGQRKNVWDQARETAPNGKVTTKHVESTVEEYRDEHPLPEPLTQAEAQQDRPKAGDEEPTEGPRMVQTTARILHEATLVNFWEKRYTPAHRLWCEWIVQLAEHNGVGVPALVRPALVLYAQETGFMDPPTECTPPFDSGL